MKLLTSYRLLYYIMNAVSRRPDLCQEQSCSEYSFSIGFIAFAHTTVLHVALFVLSVPICSEQLRTIVLFNFIFA